MRVLFTYTVIEQIPFSNDLVPILSESSQTFYTVIHAVLRVPCA